MIKFQNYWFPFIVITAGICFSPQAAGQSPAIIPGHAHNDYENPRPLISALENRFQSIEIDIHLFQNEIYVAHDPIVQIDSNRLLQKLYLDPLQTWINDHQGTVYPDYQGKLLLMFDIKTEALPTYLQLKELIQKYSDVFAVVTQGQMGENPVRAFISGNRPIKYLMEDEPKWAGIDGRPQDLDLSFDNTMMPVISQNFTRFSEWQGSGSIQIEEKQKIKKLIDQAHRQDKLLRFWSIPDQPEAWDSLLLLGVDLINTDHVEAFNAFYQMK